MDSKINDTSDYVNKGKRVEYSEVQNVFNLRKHFLKNLEKN